MSARKKCANLLQMVGDQTIAAADQADLRRIVRETTMRRPALMASIALGIAPERLVTHL